VKSLKCLFILFSLPCYVTIWLPDIWCGDSHRHINYLIPTCYHLILDIWHQYLPCYYLTLETWHLISDTGTDSYTWHLISGTWYLTPALTCYHLTPDTWHLISDTGTWHVITWHLIPDTWYLRPVLDMLSLDTWYLALDIWHRHWYVILDTWYLTPDTGTWHVITWHLIPDTDTWHVITWHLIPDTWYMTLDNWHDITHLTCYHLVPVHLTDVVAPNWILLHLTPVLLCIFMIITFTRTWHDYYIVTRHLVPLNFCAPELLYS